MNKKKEFAKVAWRIGDLQTLRPDWSDEKCAEWLENNAGHIQDRLVELGWDVMKDLLAFDKAD